MDLQLITERLAALALNVEGIVRADEYLPDSVTPPHFYCGEISFSFDQTYGGQMDVQIICRVLAGAADDKAGQALLKGFMRRTGPTSVKSALEAGRGAPGQHALDGACDDFQVVRVQNHRLYRVGEAAYVGAEWVVHVIGTDSEEETP